MRVPDWVSDSVWASSHSKEELVVSFDLAIDILNQAKQYDSKLLGWEGWVLHPDGNKGHSSHFQGTMPLDALSLDAAIEHCLLTIRQANTEWAKAPEISGGTLLFCLTFA